MLVIERLRDFFYADMVQTYQMIERDPRTFELAQIIKTERPNWVNTHLARERELIVAMLREGVEDGIFDIGDIAFSAEMLQSAMMKFRYPQLWSNLKLRRWSAESTASPAFLLFGLAGADRHGRGRASLRASKAGRLPDVASL